MDQSNSGTADRGGAGPRRVVMDLGPDRFICSLELEQAPKACAAFVRLLPLTARLEHGRWSGEAGWARLGPGPFDVPSENMTDAPAPGRLLFYGGGVSEPELLVPYGPTRFACVHGALRGAHLLTVEGDLGSLHAVGLDLLKRGGRPLHLHLADPEFVPVSEGPHA